MELKTFKTYLSEQEKLDEFVGAVIGLGARALPTVARAGSAAMRSGTSAYRAVRSSVSALPRVVSGAGSAVRTSAGNILSNPRNQRSIMMGTSQAVANRFLGNNAALPTSGGEEGMPMDIPMVEPRTSVNTRNMQSSGAAPPPVDSINPTSRPPVQFSGSYNPTSLQSMYGGLRAKLGRI